MGVSPSKKVKNDPIDVDDFDFDDGVNNEDFEEDTHDLKVSCLKAVKPEITTGMKPSNLKSDYKVAEKREPEEPPQWFKSYAASVVRMEVACYHGQSRRIKRNKERKRATKTRYSTRGKR